MVPSTIRVWVAVAMLCMSTTPAMIATVLIEFFIMRRSVAKDQSMAMGQQMKIRKGAGGINTRCGLFVLLD